MTGSRKQILYFFDPLCGWCYGFGDTMVQFSDRNKHAFEIVPVPGGMITGDRVKPISEMADYISDAYTRVQETTGCTFGTKYTEGLLRSGESILDSEPPSRALVTFRTFDIGRSIQFSRALMKAHFFDGKDYNDLSLYEELAVSFGLDGKSFMKRFGAAEMKQQVAEEFEWVSSSGIQGYPTVALRKQDKYYLLSHGFATLDTMETSLKKA